MDVEDHDDRALERVAPCDADERAADGADPARRVGALDPGWPRPRAIGRIVPVLDKRTFDLSALAGGAALEIVLCPAICVLDFARVHLSVRVHARAMAQGQRLRLTASSTLPSAEDPAQDFVEATPAIAVDVLPSTPAPGLVTGRLGEPDAYLRIVLRATQAPTPATFVAELSACLILREGAA